MSDDDIFNIDENDTYYSEVAMKYLVEANEARDQLEKCSHELEKEERLGKTFQDLNKMQFEDIIELKKIVHEKNFEIDRLNKKIATLMGDPNKLYPHGHLSISQIKTDDIIKRAQDIHRGIKHDQLLFKRTGIYQNFDSRISEVRELFDLMLMQLNSLNGKNKAVTRTLDALLKLDLAETLLRSMQQKEFRGIGGNPAIRIEEPTS